MARGVILEKVEALRHCLNRVRLKCPGTPEDLAADHDLQDIVCLNLTRAVQVSVDLPIFWPS